MQFSTQDAENLVTGCLAEVPFCTVAGIEDLRDEPEGEPDLLVDLRLPEGRHRLMVEVRASGQPRFVRAAVNQLVVLRRRYPDAYGVLVAPFISERSAAICQTEGVGFVDVSGNCRLSFRNVYIRREGRPNRYVARRELRSLYAPKACRALRVLLSGPGISWRMKHLAVLAEVSLGHVANIKRRLMELEWAAGDASGFWLTDPGELLWDWAEHNAGPWGNGRTYYAEQDADAIESGLAGVCAEAGVPYALTGGSAAFRLGVNTPPGPVTAYVQGEVSAVARALDLSDAAGGQPVRLIVPDDDWVLYGMAEVGGICVTSPIQTYLDSAHVQGSRSETAEALLDQVIRPWWEAQTRAASGVR
jgi:hypothetical protein